MGCGLLLVLRTERRTVACIAVGTVLLATDADWIAEEVDAALADDRTEVVRVRDGRDVIPMIHQLGDDVELIVLDLQIGNMGGMAVCMQVRHDQGEGRLHGFPIFMLLDRAPDVFLAKRSGADGWLIKPLDPLRLRRASNALRSGETFTEHAKVPTVTLAALASHSSD